MTMAASSLIAASALAACGTSGSDSAANLQLKPSTSTTSSSSAAAPSSAAPSTSTPSTTTSSKPAVKPTKKATKPASRSEARPATTTRTVTDTTTLGFSTVKKYDSTMAKGTAKVTTAGRIGSAKLTIKQTLVGGKVVKSQTVDRDVLKAPVNKVITIGTKKAVAAPAPSSSGSTSGGSSSGGGLNLARAAMWDRIAWCESGQRWNLVASNSTGTYYGGLMMTRDAWRIGGGLKFASVASQASRAEQITVANSLYAQLGLKPWSCRGAA
ncbi:resuscitation-promoting factor [Branchiibius cervicis]|uniref:Resuscitation-promoting factor n=1 Tax=Branchiibius cervicis TaxID=908252 RepID=A0ABW2AVY1_9MICO